MNVGRAAIASASILLGCQAPVTPPLTGGTIVQATKDGIQYRSALPRDVPHEAVERPRKAFGSSCHTAVTFPASPATPFLGSDFALSVLPLRQPLTVALGDGAFAKAVAEAKCSVQGAPLYDVRVDVHTTSVLGLVRRDCLEVHASAGPVGTDTSPCR